MKDHSTNKPYHLYHRDINRCLYQIKKQSKVTQHFYKSLGLHSDASQIISLTEKSPSSLAKFNTFVTSHAGKRKNPNFEVFCFGTIILINHMLKGSQLDAFCLSIEHSVLLF